MMGNMIFFFFGIGLMLGSVRGQEATKPDVWERFQYFVGTWEGHETGKAGIGRGARTYRFILGQQFLLSQTTSRFEPQERNPKGEVHEDRLVISYDREKKNFMARGFFIEGYVIRYALHPGPGAEGRLVFLSEAVENGAQLRVRLTYQIQNHDEFEEIFEMASGDKEFQVFIRNFWTRQKSQTSGS